MSLRLITFFEMSTDDIKRLTGKLLTARFWIKVGRDASLIGGVVLIFTGLLFTYTGVWPPLVSVEGTSMVPDLKPNDLVLMKGIDRINVTTYSDALAAGHTAFGSYGDVIVYRPMGNTSTIPVIHRAIYYVNKGQPMWPGGPNAPYSGYITKGDNNYLYDQASLISPDQPVKKEWIMGVCQYQVPYLGGINNLING